MIIRVLAYFNNNENKMSENIMTMSYAIDAQDVSTNINNSRSKNNTTNTMLMRQPSELKNSKEVDDVIATQEVAQNLAVNSNITICDEGSPEKKKIKCTRNNSEDPEVKIRDVRQTRRRSNYFKRSRQSMLANALIKRSIRW